MAKTVVGLFRSYESAQQAVAELIRSGIEQGRISLVRREGNTAAGTDASSRAQDEDADKVDPGSGAAIGAGTGAVIGGALGAFLAGVTNIFIPGLGSFLGVGPLAATIIGGAGIGAVSGGVMGALVNSGVPEDHAHLYAQGVERGNTLVTVHAEDDEAEEAAEILSRYDPIDIDDDARTTGVAGSSIVGDSMAGTSTAGAASMAGTGMAADAAAATGSTVAGGGLGREPVEGQPVEVRGSEAVPLPAVASSGADIDDLGEDRTDEIESTSTQRLAGRDVGARETIPLVAEQVEVGKRQVEAGTARVRTRVYQRPVEETVTLREEKVNVERRPADREIRPGEDAFREEVIEVRETREEPVVRKTARVVEEVVIDKQAVEHQETVRDTVRKTDVEVERGPDTPTNVTENKSRVD